MSRTMGAFKSLSDTVRQTLSPCKIPMKSSPIAKLGHSRSVTEAEEERKSGPEPAPSGEHLVLTRAATSSNQRTRNQFRPRVTGKGAASGYQLRQYAEATLGGGSLRKVVKLPEGEDENEWLAVTPVRGGR